MNSGRISPRCGPHCSRQELIAKYGHLRPGTYDITSPPTRPPRKILTRCSSKTLPLPNRNRSSARRKNERFQAKAAAVGLPEDEVFLLDFLPSVCRGQGIREVFILPQPFHGPGHDRGNGREQRFVPRCRRPPGHCRPFSPAYAPRRAAGREMADHARQKKNRPRFCTGLCCRRC